MSEEPAVGMLAACGTTEPTRVVTVTAPPPSVSPSAPDVTEGVPTGTPTGDESATTGPKTVKFGQTIKGQSGNTVTVGAPKVVTPTDTQGQSAEEWVTMEVTFVNGTKEVANAGDFIFQATTGDKAAPSFFNSDVGVEMPTASVMPGKSLKWKIGFGRSKGKDFVLEVGFGLAVAGYYQ